MLIAELLFALFFSWIVVGIISFAFGTKGPWDNFLWFFLVVGLFAWVGGVWLRPFGPLWMGIGWLPIIFAGLFVAMLLTAASPRDHRKRLAAKGQTADDETRSAVNVFFWVLIVCLLFFGMGHHYWYPVAG